MNPENASRRRGSSQSGDQRRVGCASGRLSPVLPCKIPLPKSFAAVGSRLLLAPQAANLDARMTRQVSVEAVGLNFFDLVQLLGAMPSRVAGQFARGHQHSVGIGCDFAGTLCSGDPVFGLAGSPGTLAELLPNIPASALRPRGVSSEEAAALPAVFLTAKAALTGWARLCCGERLLLHAASGGAGLAALAAARRCGQGAGSVFATAGSARKQCLLRLRGICHVSSSRDSRACSADMRWAMGEFGGATLVLNCLTHDDYVPRGLSLTAPGGRFLELSKVKAPRFHQNREFPLKGPCVGFCTAALSPSLSLHAQAWSTQAVSAFRPDLLSAVLLIDRRAAEVHPECKHAQCHTAPGVFCFFFFSGKCWQPSTSGTGEETA